MRACRTLAVLTLCLAPISAHAQDQDAPTCPDSATNNFDIHVCASELYVQRKTLLEQLMREVRSSLAPEDGLLDRRPILDSAQTAWTTYAQAQCHFVASAYDGGTMLPIVDLICLTEQTNRRVRELAPVLCEADTESGSCTAADQYLAVVGPSE